MWNLFCSDWCFTTGAADLLLYMQSIWTVGLGARLNLIKERWRTKRTAAWNLDKSETLAQTDSKITKVWKTTVINISLKKNTKKIALLSWRGPSCYEFIWPHLGRRWDTDVHKCTRLRRAGLITRLVVLILITWDLLAYRGNHCHHRCYKGILGASKQERFTCWFPVVPRGRPTAVGKAWRWHTSDKLGRPECQLILYYDMKTNAVINHI